MSLSGADLTQDKVASLQDNAGFITAGLMEAHSIVDSLTGVVPSVESKNSETNSIIAKLEITLQDNRALISNLVKRLIDLKNKF